MARIHRRNTHKKRLNDPDNHDGNLKKVNFHFNPKERQCQRMFQLLYNCTHFTCQQGYAQNPSRQASAVCEPRTSRCTSWVSKRQRNQRSNCQHQLDHRESKGIPEKTSTSASLTMLKPLTVWITTNCGKFLKSWEYQTTLSVSRETCMWIKKQQLEP